MVNQSLLGKCPACGTATTQPIYSETCLRANKNADQSLESLLSTCVKPTDLSNFLNNDIGEDPCIHCSYNQITEAPGSFLEMRIGKDTEYWIELHKCPDCSTIYCINTKDTLITEI